jgi:poly(3-hydroxybutyrate) depolymerase
MVTTLVGKWGQYKVMKLLASNRQWKEMNKTTETDATEEKAQAQRRRSECARKPNMNVVGPHWDM